MAQYILPRTGILAFMDDESREQLTTYGNLVSTVAGQVLIEEGQDQTRLYLVISGTFDVTTHVSGRDIHLDKVGVGDCLGEVAVFQPGPASATVTCADAGQLWYMEVDHLQQFLLDWHHASCALLFGINTILSRRLKRANTVIKANEIMPNFLSVRAKKRVEGAKLA